MKLYTFSSTLQRQRVEKIMLIMKLTTLIMLIGLLQCSAKTFSQNVSLNESNTSLKKVLQHISKQTGYVFFYESKDVANKSVNIQLKDVQLPQALTECLKDKMLTYKIVGKTIILQQADPVKSDKMPSEAPAPVPITVTGQVTDETGTGLPGVTITLKGGKILAASGPDGKFSVQVPDRSTLLFSFIGYNTKEIPATSAGAISVKLEVAVSGLNEVVVVGYGTSSRTNLATATSTVSSKEYKSAVVTTLDQALQGRASGVQVTETSGQPGSDAVIRIRGNNSLSGDNQPLYVVDGFPLPPYVEAPAAGAGTLPDNGLYGINPNDIESISVLKDAAATAIYGSRGANGVILIKTKSGKNGGSKIEFVDKTTFGKVSTPYQMATPAEFADIVNEGFVLNAQAAPFTDADITALGTGSGTNWFNAITRTGVREDATLNISGGNGKTTYYISGDYLNDKGAIIGANNLRGTVRANVNSDVNNWYTIKAQLSVVRQNTARAITDSRNFPGGDGPILDALRASPITPVDYYGFNGASIPGFNDPNLFSNPVSELTQKIDNTLNDFDVVNFENDFKILPGLQFVVNLGSNQNLTRRQVFFPPTIPEGYSQNGSGSSTLANTYSYNLNAYLNYVKTFNQVHEINLTAGVEYNKATDEILNTITSGFDIPSYGIYNIGSADVQSVASYKEDRIIQSGFLRANYSYKERYVLNTSIRLDGASPFAENKKYGFFPAAGFAWNLNQEDFMKNVTVISNSKLRVSYGETGSQAISPYSSLAQYGNAFYQTGANTINTVLFPSSLGNANLSWERTKQLDAGVDFSIIKNFLNISFDYYNKETDGLLQPRALPSQTGFTSVEDNYGSIRNRGLELSLEANVVKSGAFTYNTKIEISHNKNTLLNLGSLTAAQYVGLGGNLQGGVSGILQPGKEIGLFYGEKVIGIVQTGDIVNGVPKYAFPGGASNQAPGEWKYLDVNKDNVINEDDREVLGKSNPDFTYGWNNDITYKNFSLNLFFTGSQGNDILNLTRFYLSDGTSDYAGIFFNQTQDWYEHRWTPTNPTNDPRYPGIQKAISLADINSSEIENGSYFRLKSATIAYTFPTTKVFKNARLFFTATNLFTITKYTGNDPEVGSYGQSLLQQGIDYGSYPSNKTYTIGVSTDF